MIKNSDKIEIQKIAIKFRDKEFGSAYKALMSLFSKSYDYRGEFTYSKEEICLLVNQSIMSLYIMFQNPFIQHGLQHFNKSEHISAKLFLAQKERIESMLLVTENRIFLNEEIDELLKDRKSFGKELIICSIKQGFYEIV